MLKKRVLTVSLSLLVCLCCCFSGFGSVKAFADTISIDFTNMYTFRNTYYFGLYKGNYFDVNGNSTGSGSSSWGTDVSVSSTGDYNLNNSAQTNVNYFALFLTSPETYLVINDLYDYYLYLNVVGGGSSTTFRPDTFFYTNYLNNSSNAVYFNDYILKDYSSGYGSGFEIYSKIDFSSNNAIRAIYLKDSNGGNFSSNVSFWGGVLPVPKGTSEEQLNSIISAINNQTNQLSSDIGQAADDVQHSIEDQYQMEDEEDFGFSDIQQQYEEKMGVLTFGTETTLQMLDLFSPSNAGEAYIRVPGWSMEVQGETYQIWDEYIFYFDSIEENFPFLVTTMRTFTVAMFYIAIVSYINKVYERNFLAK